jgi:hypothetical protein
MTYVLTRAASQSDGADDDEFGACYICGFAWDIIYYREMLCRWGGIQ